MSERTLEGLDLQGFRAAAESLKLYRRADLNDPEHGTSLMTSNPALFKDRVRPNPASDAANSGPSTPRLSGARRPSWQSTTTLFRASAAAES